MEKEICIFCGSPSEEEICPACKELLKGVFKEYREEINDEESDKC